LEEDSDLSVWSEPVLLYEVLFLLLQGIGYPILAIFIDILSSKPRTMSFVSSFVDLVTLSCFWKQRGPDITTVQEEDSDVIAEEDRVNSGSANDDLVVVSNLGKVYSNGKIAVKSLSFGIHPGEVFGLLGINGTRFAILILGGLGLRKLIISFFSILHFVQFQGREKLRLFR
jgi:ATP-binding cassette subfamily A (ABC1) protein 1